MNGNCRCITTKYDKLEEDEVGKYLKTKPLANDMQQRIYTTNNEKKGRSMLRTATKRRSIRLNRASTSGSIVNKQKDSYHINVQGLFVNKVYE